MSDALQGHLAGGVTTVARAWAVTRRDGVVMGFTDHDRALRFEGIEFAPGAGLTARAFEQATGLSVDNSEAVGVLSDAAITEDDIAAGRYDRAAVRVWLVNWANPDERRVLFAGHLGEVTRAEGGFTAELRGLAEALNREQGRVYHPRCSAVLGDAQCRANLAQPGMTAEVALGAIDAGQLVFAGLGGFDDGWFAGGRLEVLSGAAAGLEAQVRADRRQGDGQHRLSLWQMPGAALLPGDRVRLWPGCDRTGDTCRLKFGNFNNFRGFPHIPGEDWMVAAPSAAVQRQSTNPLAGLLS